jgi:hypothetical protein
MFKVCAKSPCPVKLDERCQAAGMVHQVHLQEARPLIVPVGIGTNRDLRFEQRARLGQTAALPQALWITDAQAIHRGRAHLLQMAIDLAAHVQESIGP